MKSIEKVHFYNIKSFFEITKILNECGKDMARKYNLHHWENPMLKTMIIVVLCLLKNKVYLVKYDGLAEATFQLKSGEDELFFEKLAVNPISGNKGYGSFCMKAIEKKAEQLGKHKVRMEVYDQSQHAIDFYLAKGYSKVGETHTLKYNSLIMEKEL